MAETQRYIFEVRPPLGWHPAGAPNASGALMLTIGGLPAGEAPAAMMVRPIARGDDSFESFATRELDALCQSFPDSDLRDADGINFPGRRYIAKQIRSASTHRVAMVTLLEQADHFVWFGLIVSDRKRQRAAVAAYRGLLKTFREESYNALVEALRGEA